MNNASSSTYKHPSLAGHARHATDSAQLGNLRRLYGATLLISILIPIEVVRLGNSSSSALLVLDVLSLGCLPIFGIDRSALRHFGLPVGMVIATSILSCLVAVAAFPTAAPILIFSTVRLVALSALIFSGIRISFRSRIVGTFGLLLASILIFSRVTDTDLSFAQFVMGRGNDTIMYAGGRFVMASEMIAASQDLFFLGSTKYVWALFFLCALMSAVGTGMISKRLAQPILFSLVVLIAFVLTNSKSDHLALAFAIPLCLLVPPRVLFGNVVSAFVWCLLIVSSSLALPLVTGFFLTPQVLGVTLRDRLLDWNYVWANMDIGLIPSVLGYGPNGFRILQQSIGSFLGFGHNAGLTLLVELGLPTAIAALYSFFSLSLVSIGASNWVRGMLSVFLAERAFVMLTADVWFGFDIMLPVTTLTILAVAKSDIFTAAETSLVKNPSQV